MWRQLFSSGTRLRSMVINRKNLELRALNTCLIASKVICVLESRNIKLAPLPSFSYAAGTLASVECDQNIENMF